MLEGAYGGQKTGGHPLIEAVSALVVESLKCSVFVCHGHGGFEFEGQGTRYLRIVCVSPSIVHLLGYAIDASCGTQILIWNHPSVSHHPRMWIDGSLSFAFWGAYVSSAHPCLTQTSIFVCVLFAYPGPTNVLAFCLVCYPTIAQIQLGNGQGGLVAVRRVHLSAV